MTDAKPESPASWPYGSLFFCGHFGPATPGSRRLSRQGYLAWTILLGSIALTAIRPGAIPAGRYILVLGAAIASIITIRAFRNYFAELDELSLRIQYEAIAFAFSGTLMAAMVLGAVHVLEPFEFNPLLIMLAEPLRGVGLVLAARRYR